MKSKTWLWVMLGAAGLALISFSVLPTVSGQSNGTKAGVAPLAGTGTLSGTVKAPKEFKAAKVYAKNVDKKVVYMVYTEDGHYQVVDLFPGTYEVSVTKNGFSEGDVQKVTVTAGGNATADFTLKEGTYRPNQQMRSGLPKNEPLLSYDELYPPGHARQTIERTCILCHGPDFLPNKQWDEQQWNAGIDLMQNPYDNAGARLVPGTFAPGEREELVAYLVKNFGPDSKKRGLAVPDEPLDEKSLGKAMFIEYHISPLADGTARGFHDAHLSQNGDVWYVDARGLQVGKMDPRTATWTDYPSRKMPVGTSGSPGTLDSCGSIARPERSSATPTTPLRRSRRTATRPSWIPSRIFGRRCLGQMKLPSGIGPRGKSPATKFPPTTAFRMGW